MFTLAIALLAPLHTASAQGADTCFTGGAIEDAVNNPGLVTDCEVLLAARDILAGSATLNWGARRPIAQWEGVSAFGSPLRVTSLYLQRKGLSGEIPEELGNLANLGQLYLFDNQLTGEIPAELGGLTNLSELSLSDNQLIGEIPTTLGRLASLESLSLFQNQLTGEIPAELGGLANLKWLSLSGNNLSGKIPQQLGSLSKLMGMSLGDNQLTGDIPGELGELSRLENLDLGENQLTGAIPVEIGGLKNLKSLVLYYNRLTGKLPVELGDLANLEVLNLAFNQLTGEIPAKLGSPAKLNALILSDNQLTGEIPAELGNLSNMQVFSLSNNLLTGHVPAWLGNFSNLQQLYLDRNQLTGELPIELGNLPNLQSLLLGDNNFSGCIPLSLTNVAETDLYSIGLPYCDILLSGLTVNPGTLVPTFDPHHTEYTLAVGQSQVTVVPVSDHDASFVFLDHDDFAINDADDSLEGHQVDFSPDVPAIRIRVDSGDGRATRTYTIAAQTTGTCTSGGAVADAADNPGLVSDCEALLAARDILAGTATLDWSASTPIDQWEGVTLAGIPQRVTELVLIENGLTGVIPAELGSLSRLRQLYLYQNRLTGTDSGRTGRPRRPAVDVPFCQRTYR